ncbi:putative ribose/galactose/methyl galactoside import ATP-binding protein 1 [Vallitalea longa]|uniref:Ribose/galactose/methyl galactoside import ATP-binding protein 1 n=1 Tax=Vallitalea longa TaxID=2936439 RepID=A0A9W5YF32_9FIRM|nr:sugar ABC transporter ATP-binding protein [Vallitalea longa]GKX31556.1 putative ribose/galactose/methyl galactoside import ATP-binding protein 1 [Vallitalea longa]
MNHNLVELKHINKTFPGVKALDNVNLTLKRGEVLGLLGENGAGKSTLVKVLSGVYKKDEGEIIVDGEKVNFNNPKEAESKGIAIIHQELNLCRHLTVAENMFLTREDSRWGFLSKKQTNIKAQKILDSLNLDLKATDLVSNLQVSKQQMVEICKALSSDAEIIIMDEPTSALTDKEIKELFRVINKLKGQNKGIIYISHRLEELVHIVDRVTILRDGKYITTLDYGKDKLPEIISHMVGREITDKFPRVECEIGEEVFRVENISTPSGVKGVSFQAKKGEIIAIAGLMGAGRTELVRGIFGADKKTSGTIFIDNKEISIKNPRDAIKKGLFCVPEDRKKDGLCIKMSLKQNITLPNMNMVTALGFIQDERESTITRDAIEKLSIKTPSENQLVKNLSGGNQQKIVIGKWLASGAKVVMFDEPTRGIDVAAKIEIYNLMNKLKQEGIGVIYVSSELPEVLGISDRILVMCNGRLKADLKTLDTDQEEIMYYATQYDSTEVI